MASMFDLAKHDARFHKDGYKEGDTCMFRQAIKEYEGVDDLSVAGKISDALEDAEVLEGQIAKMKNENMKNRLREHQKAALSRAKMHLPKKMAPNAPLPHDESAFPSENDAQWQNALMTYPNGASWNSAGSGSTIPHYIDFNGKRYFVKQADYAKTHGNPNSKYDAKACRNEAQANQFIRMAGFNAPDSKFYDTPYGKFAVSEAADLSGGQLIIGTGDKKLREKVADAYPLMALMYNMDLMQNADNAFIDKNGNPVFLDNGSTFGFSAQGARNKYYDYDKRTEPFPTRSTDGGLTGLLDVGNNGSAVWNKFLKGQTSQEDLLKLCAKYNMSALVEAGEKKGLIPKSAVTALKEYAKKLDLLSDKYREKPLAQQRKESSGPYRVSPADAFWKSVGRPDLKQIEADAAATEKQTESKVKPKGKGEEKGEDKQKGSGSESADNEAKIAALAKKHGVSVPKFTKNEDGTVTLSGFGNASTKQMLDFVHELNDEGLLPGFIASLSGNGQVQVQSAINLGNVQTWMKNITANYGGWSAGVPSSSGSIPLHSNISLSSYAANNIASTWNVANANSGYTAKATQTSTGEWQVTLYPTDRKQIAKTFAPKDGDGAASSSGSSTQTVAPSSASGTSTYKHVSQPYTPPSAPKPRPMAQGNSTSTAMPTSTPAAKPAAPAPASQPTITPAQVQTTTPANRQKAVDRLMRMMNRQGCPANLKAAYQATINRLNGNPANYQPPTATAAAATPTVSAPNQQTSAPVSARPKHPSRPRSNVHAAAQTQPAATQQQSAPATGLPANIPQTAGAQALLKRYNAATSPSLKATYAAMLSKMAAAASAAK